jgi:hypothetical protein
MNNVFKTSQRSCSNCTKCCEGWLSGEVNGYSFYPGRPCHFMKCDGCSIYKNRPEDPCKTFRCEWLNNPDIPEWLKPSLSNALLVKQSFVDEQQSVHIFYKLLEAGSTMSSEVLSFVIQYCLANKINLLYEIKGGKNIIGSEAFAKACRITNFFQPRFKG